ncbi:MAG: hypothetical protein QXY52_01170 [Conexivisphaerales archaeon]
MKENKVSTHRLTRFGIETLKKVFTTFGTEIEVVNHDEKTQGELVEDLITTVSHFAGRLYGMRSHRYGEVIDGVKKLVGQSINAT